MVHVHITSEGISVIKSSE